MVNQELKDYVSAQLKAGVGKEAVKKALIEAGWYDAEVQEALQAAGAVSAPVVTKDIVQPPKTVSFGSPQIQPEKPSTAAFLNSAAAKSPAATTMPPVTPVSVKSPTGTFAPSVAAAAKPSVPSGGSFVAPTAVGGGMSGGKSRKAGYAILGTALVIVLAAGGVLLARNTNINTQLGSLSAENDGLKTQLTALTKDKEVLSSEAAFLKEERGALDAQLSILLPQKTGEEIISVRGTVGTSASGLYMVRTDRGLVVTVKNSKDAKVASILKEIIGAVITVSGLHVAGTREITVTAINGMPLN